MKKKSTIILALFLVGNLIKAQDTLYIYKSGLVVTKRAISAIDSVIFYNAGGSGSFTCGTSAVTDIDGNTYNTVSIGGQCWLKENLKTTKYSDGTTIPNVTNDTTWGTLTTGAYCDNNNTPSNSTTYGKLYNWYAATDAHKICPMGWCVPSDGEWNIMEKYLDNTVDTTVVNNWVGTDIGNKLKEYGTDYWASGNNGTNSSNFTALPGGRRDYDGSFCCVSSLGHWWTSTAYNATAAWSRSLYYCHATVYRGPDPNVEGFSVRCVKDN